MSIPGRSILSHKGSGARPVIPKEALLNLADILVSNRIVAVPVLYEKHALVGLVSEQDIVTALSEHHDEVRKLTAADIMVRNLHTCSRDRTVTNAMQ